MLVLGKNRGMNANTFTEKLCSYISRFQTLSIDQVSRQQSQTSTPSTKQGHQIFLPIKYMRITQDKEWVNQKASLQKRRKCKITGLPISLKTAGVILPLGTVKVLERQVLSPKSLVKLTGKATGPWTAVLGRLLIPFLD